MSAFDPVYLEAAYVHGASRLRAFLDIELPLIAPGVAGSATFSIILSFNETVRTTLVQGPLNTVQTYIWSRYLQIGLTPSIYALMSIMIVLRSHQSSSRTTSSACTPQVTCAGVRAISRRVDVTMIRWPSAISSR